MWSVAPVSTIQGGFLNEWKWEWWENWEEKTEYCELRANIPDDEEPTVFGLGWGTTCPNEWAAGNDAADCCWINAINCWHCSIVMGSCGGETLVKSVPCTWLPEWAEDLFFVNLKIRLETHGPCNTYQSCGHEFHNESKLAFLCGWSIYQTCVLEPH